MKRRAVYSLIFLVFMLGISDVAWGLQAGEVAPDFALKDLTGKYVSLSGYKGKVVYLLFGATWCPYCVAEIPKITEIHAKYSQKGLVLLNIDILESREKVLAFANRKKLVFPVLLDDDGEIAQRYGVIGVPTKVLIDRTGKVVCINCPSIEEKLAQLLP